MNLNHKIGKLFIFSVLDLIIGRLGKYIGILILINVVSRESIGILGIATGYLAFIGYLSLAPEQILLRDYPKTDKHYLNENLSAFVNFWIVRNIVILFIGLLLSFIFRNQGIVLAIVFFGLLLHRILESLTNLIQLVFYVDFKQDEVAKINTFLNTLLLLSFILLLFLFKSIYAYIIILVVGQLLFCVFWFWYLAKRFRFVYRYSSRWFSLIKKNLWEFTFWYHLSSATMNVVQNIGPVILSFFVSLTVVGDYTIALKIATFFLLISQLMQKASFVHFATEGAILVQPNPLESKKTLYQHVLLYIALSLLGFALFALFGKALIYTFLTREGADIIYVLSLIILVGMVILNISRPLMAFASARLSLKKGFLRVYLPVLVMGVAAFSVVAKYFGPLGLAFTSIINYAILLLLIKAFIAFAKR